MYWREVIWMVLQRPAHEDVIVPKSRIAHPLSEGFEPTLGEPQGQKADYEYTLPDGRRIHVREYDTYYKVHWDYVSPKRDPILHLKLDAPEWYNFLCGIVALAIIIGGIVLLSKPTEKKEQ